MDVIAPSDVCLHNRRQVAENVLRPVQGHNQGFFPARVLRIDIQIIDIVIQLFELGVVFFSTGRMRGSACHGISLIM
jgi:hypothetical protein